MPGRLKREKNGGKTQRRERRTDKETERSERRAEVPEIQTERGIDAA